MDLSTHNKIESLKFLAGSADVADLSNIELEEMIAAAKASGDQELVKTVQMIGKHQMAFLLTERFRILAEDRQANQAAAMAAWTN